MPRNVNAVKMRKHSIYYLLGGQERNFLEMSRAMHEFYAEAEVSERYYAVLLVSYIWIGANVLWISMTVMAPKFCPH